MFPHISIQTYVISRVFIFQTVLHCKSFFKFWDLTEFSSCFFLDLNHYNIQPKKPKSKWTLSFKAEQPMYYGPALEHLNCP
uniref:Uncharacterized protein n=1 Tax=Arundo donax TaxID=35708 RepID=A0A0A9HA31_ARUDO